MVRRYCFLHVRLISLTLALVFMLCSLAIVGVQVCCHTIIVFNAFLFI